jgi:hypothetical protein
MASTEKKHVSTINWLGTLILSAIPGVHLVFVILTIIFAKAQAKRSFAIASLVLTVLHALGIVAAFLFLPEQMKNLAEIIRNTAKE